MDNSSGDEVLHFRHDSKLLVIYSGLDVLGDVNRANTDSFPVLAHEQTGAGGTRWVLSIPGAIFEVEEENFSKVVFPPDAKKL